MDNIIYLPILKLSLCAKNKQKMRNFRLMFKFNLPPHKETISVLFTKTIWRQVYTHAQFKWNSLSPSRILCKLTKHKNTRQWGQQKRKVIKCFSMKRNSVVKILSFPLSLYVSIIAMVPDHRHHQNQHHHFVLRTSRGWFCFCLLNLFRRKPLLGLRNERESKTIETIWKNMYQQVNKLNFRQVAKVAACLP